MDATESENTMRRVALVTGAASGIGASVCRRLVATMDILVISDIQQERLDTISTELRGINPSSVVIRFVTDMRDEASVVSMVNQVQADCGRLDFLIHCAGVLRLPGSGPRMMAQLSKEECDFVIDTNLKGTFLMNRAVLPMMMQQKSGFIINIASTSGKVGRAFDSVYCASKHGVVGLTEALAQEMKSYGVRVAAILPDAVSTPLWDQNGPIQAPEASLHPDRIAEVIAYMVSMPTDMVLENVAVYPFQGSKRRRKKTSQ